MSHLNTPTILALIATLATIATAGSNAMAQDTPDSIVSPLTGAIEIADPVWSGASRDVHYVVDPGDGSMPEVDIVTAHALDDHAPKVAVAENGDAWVTWWRDDSVDQVLVRKRNGSDGSWNAERVLSESGENSRNPVVAYDGAQPWAAYEIDLQGQTAIAVGLIIDEPDPIGIRLVLGQTDHAGLLELTIRSENGLLWVTWVDSDSDVAWVEYDAATDSWSLPAYESYADDTARDARARIRTTVTGSGS